MGPQHHAEFLQKVGHWIKEHEGVFWFDIFSRAYTTIPYDVRIDPAAFSPLNVLEDHGLIMRYSCSLDRGVPS